MPALRDELPRLAAGDNANCAAVLARLEISVAADDDDDDERSLKWLRAIVRCPVLYCPAENLR